MKIFKEDGFSIVQVMIAAGMMGIVSLGMMKMMENQRKSTKSMKTSMEVDSFYNEAKTYFSKDGYCSKNFEGEVLKSGDKFEIMELIKPNGKTLYKVGEIYGNRTFKISKIDIIDFEKETDTSGIMKLQFSLTKMGDSYGAKSYKRILKLDTSLDENKKVVNCATFGSLISGIAGGNLEGTEKVENVEQAIKDIQAGKSTEATKKVEKTIESNQQLKNLQNTIDSLRKANELMEQNLNE
ncbi:hypothetical protein [Halobacteriovorax sp. HLS]|uniref:type IV pilus modification PilV family protein n=1 Tax=Halobacteriovorax sp. HLS TaxID=2234000 RepID=UPI000FD6F247|nr:hypothetical protein [Halobacteriovorax sp. HLS]